MTACERTPVIRALDLFCGVGGLTHGLALSGIEVTAGIDIDPACRYPYEANNKAKFIEEDVNELSASGVAAMIGGADFSMIAGCAPCQPFSTYSRTGRSNKRGGDWQLVKKFGRLVREAQPDLVTMENVPQLLEHPVFDEFLGCLDGYSVEWSVVQAVRIGIPQTRKRLVLIASRLGAAGLTLPQDAQELKTVREAIGGLRPIKAGESDPRDRLHTSSRLSKTNLDRIRHSQPGGTWRDWPDELQVTCHKRSTGSTYPSVYGRMSWDDASPTITTQCFGYGNGRFGHPEQDRAISLREAAILQTFPLDYAFVRPDEPVRFSVLGRMIGNAVPVRLGEIVGQTVLAHASQYLRSTDLGGTTD
ncbi:DNA cytosine methyltransferase [Ferrimicrobium sp.]|uniref:DNA cytosine methyltransferase n=1 Tax=Ferrimicrobium sp. TaxID=2926050 RepID=UPI002613D464|nr:DNA cytosine methyltransferase [Ferrimicrobium sp.]